MRARQANRTRYRARLGWVLGLAGVLAGCGPKSIDISNDCDDASQLNWTINVTGGRVAAGDIQISVGETVRLEVAVFPALYTDCPADGPPVASVDWQLTDPAVAALSGTLEATLQGRSPGATGVRATVRFGNGTTGSATSLFPSTTSVIRVVP